ncbi:MAG: hypothetical protein HY821_00130, partial [Acidobacteria bacterium]|nr:hypothetical protein [Acidobacteriota bacterium]
MPTRRQVLQAPAALAAPLPPFTPKLDFRYTPLQWQTAYCFPDDPYKSLVDHRGALLCGHPGRKGIDFLPLIVEFTLLGMEDNRVTRQQLEAPGVPIVHTHVERPNGRFEIITFATNRSGEGRVDNVLITPSARAVPILNLRTRGTVAVTGSSATLDAKPLLTANRPPRLRDTASGWQLQFPLEQQGGEVLLRFPQQGQAVEAKDGRALLDEARAWWKQWRPFAGSVDWELPRPYMDFLTACARNILQAREVRNGDLTFQVGPTCYRGLWVVDGHFILESARYLGYQEEAHKGLRTTWNYQRPDGALDAGGGPEHYKDAAIAMFSTVRQCELSQNWADFQQFLPNIRRAAAFLNSRRDPARHGLIVPGFADGGFTKGIEFTNTLWSLAGLQSAAAAPGGESLKTLSDELRAGFDAAARQEMLRHPSGFDYLPMVLKEDPAWQRSEWDRPRPQVAQWALSQAIFPGVVFAPSDPIVRGHIALMRSCTREDLPIETGWLPHEGLWTYNAGFAAHAALWAGDAPYARTVFHGFLNHASPLYCWREEQPVRGSLVSGYVGDMPHNWASAECVLYLRHMLALEDQGSLRLLAGIASSDLSFQAPFRLADTPTRFGPVTLSLTPEKTGWTLVFRRGAGPAPQAVQVPSALGPLPFRGAKGAAA